MKLVTGILITLATLSAQAQTNACNMEKLELEVRNYLYAADALQKTVVGNCLQEVIQKDLSRTNKALTEETQRQSVLNIAAAIKHEKLVAEIKCETSGTPGCGSEDSTEALDAEADAKRADVSKQQEDGSRDW